MLMKVLYRTEYGGPEVLEVREVHKPVPKKNEVLIKVECTTVNRTDGGILLGNYLLLQFFTGIGKPKNNIPGTDVAGTVVATGSEVKKFKEGDRVFGLNDNSHQTQAEFCTWPDNDSLIKIPDGVSFEDAVASIEGGHYALNFINKVRIKEGDRVMVNGGTGAIGSAAIQMLIHRGIIVAATCRTEHMDKVRALGASKVIDYTQEDFTKQNDLYNFVFDAVGKSRYKDCKRIMKPGAVYISSELGPKAENLPLSLWGLFHRGKRVKFPVPVNIPKSLRYVKDMLEHKTLKPLIDPKKFSVDEAQEAYTYVMSGEKVGNVILNF